MLPETMRCYLVRKLDADNIEAAVEQRPLDELPPGEVLIRVSFSAVNYKDALAAHGHPGVVRTFPHVPGIDAAGTVVASSAAEVPVGRQVVVNTYELGAERWGGWAEFIRVPADWVVPLPAGLSLAESMILGTAGLTAACCVRALQQHDVRPDAGEIVVTGATGGVGIMAVRLLAKLGYHVVAVTGKPERHEWLRSFGAAQVLSREAALDDTPRPLLTRRWAGAVDTVGGKLLSTLLRSTKNAGCIAACGMVGGASLSVSVYPFILRGVTLTGIDAAWLPRARRLEAWQHLAGDWRLDRLADLATPVHLEDLDALVRRMLLGELCGRILVEL